MLSWGGWNIFCVVLGYENSTKDTLYAESPM